MDSMDEPGPPTNRSTQAQPRGRAGQRRRAPKDVIDFGKPEALGRDGPEFLSSAARMQFGTERQEDDIIEKLQAKAAAAADAFKPHKPKPRKELQAKFGGAKAHLGTAADEFEVAGGLDALELEFVQEIDEGPQAFVEPHDDDFAVDVEGEKAVLTTPEVWEEMDYQQRKEDVVQELSETGAAVGKAAVELPKLCADNDRLQKERAWLQDTIARLEKEEAKLYKRFPALKKKIEKGVERERAQGGAMTDSRKDRLKELEKRREREARRRRQIEKGVEELEGMEGGGGEVFSVQTFGLYRVLRTYMATAQVRWFQLTLLVDPYTKSIEYIKLVMPLCLSYFQSLRWQALNNAVLLLIVIPQIMAWALGNGVEGEETLLVPSPTFLYSYVPRTMFGSDVAILYISLFIPTYAVLYLATLQRLFADLQVRSWAGLTVSTDTPFRYAKVAFNSWNCSVNAPSERRALANNVLAQLILLRAQDEENDAGGSDQALLLEQYRQMDRDERRRAVIMRTTELLLNLIVVVGGWVLLETFVPSDILEYPRGAQRIISPIVAAAFNVLLIPFATHELVKLGGYPRKLIAPMELARLFAARTANFIIILRRQYLVLQDPRRVLPATQVGDACFCEDEVGVTLFWYWILDWGAIMFKTLIGPALFPLTRMLLKSKTKKPQFLPSSWMVDQASSQLLLLLTLPLLPAAGLIAVGASFFGFYIQRVLIINLWSPPRKMPIDAKSLRFAFSVVSCLCLLTATIAYFYLWVYVSTSSLRAPICQVPILYRNATLGDPCTIDAFTGAEGVVDCAPYLESACKGRDVFNQTLAMFAGQTPAAVLASRLPGFSEIIGTPLLAWGAAIIIFLRYRVQHNYRVLFQHYVDEKRYRLLIKIQNLERSLTKQDRLLAIQRAN